MAPEQPGGPEDTDACPAARSKALLPLKTPSDEVQTPGFLSDLNCEGSPSSPSESSGWRRVIRPLANCIACGDVESELSKLRLQKSSTAARLGDCIRKLQEQDSSMEVLEKKLQETLSDLDTRTAELEAEKRRTSSLSTLLLNDTVKEQKLQEEANLVAERLEKAQAEMKQLVSSLETERSEKEYVLRKLRTKEAEATSLSEQLGACKEEATKCAAELQTQLSMLDEKRQESQQLGRQVAESARAAEDLRGNLAKSQGRCQELHGALEAKAIEHQDMGNKLNERTQELTEAQDEIRQISEKLLRSNEELDQQQQRLQALSSALEMAQEETKSKTQQVENVSMAAEDLLGCLAASKQQLQSFEQEKLAMTESMASSAKENQRISRRFEQLTADISEEQSKNTALKHTIEEQCCTMREWEEMHRVSSLAAKSAMEQKTKLEEELTQKQQENDALAAKLSSVTQDLEAKSQENASATAQLSAAANGYVAKCQEHDALAAELSAAKATTSSLEQKVLDLDASARAARSENVVLVQALKEKAVEIQKLVQDLKLEKDQLQTFDRQLSVVTTSLEDAVSDKQSLAFELEGLHMEREDLEGRLARAQSKNVELQSALDEMSSQAARSKEARDAAVQEICSWQINARLYQSFVEHVSNQRDTCLAECREHQKAAQQKQREIDVLTIQLRHAERQSTDLAQNSLVELTDQLGQSDARIQMLSASIEVKDSEMHVLSRELARKGMETEDYLGRVKVIKERWGESEKTIEQLRQSLGVCQSDKDSLQKELAMKGQLLEEMGLEMRQAKEQLSKSQQETNILDRCLEDKQLQHDLLAREVGSKDSLIQNLQCELTAVKVQKSETVRDHEGTLQILKSTLEEQLQQNDRLQQELVRKHAECEEVSSQNRSLFEKLSQRTLERDDFGSQLDGTRALIKKLKDELHSAQTNETALSEKCDELSAERLELQQHKHRLSALSAQLRKEADRSLAELQRKVDFSEKQRSEIMRLQKELKDNKAEIKNLNRCVTLEVRRREEAATRCAELLCSHPSMNIEAWIGKVRASSTSAEWQLVAGSGPTERVVLRGGREPFQQALTSYETPCIIINHREQRKGSKTRSDQERVAVNIYDSKKPGAVEVRKPSKMTSTRAPNARVPIVYDKICKLFNQNALVYDQHFGVVRPFLDEDASFSPRSSRSSSCRASSRAF